MNWVRNNIIQSLDDKEFREDYAASALRRNVAYQIRAMREARGWHQSTLGLKAHKPQSNISRIEDPDYGRVSLQTLIDLAAAFDVALLVRFVPFSELLQQTADLSQEALDAASYEEDRPAIPGKAARGEDAAAILAARTSQIEKLAQPRAQGNRKAPLRAPQKGPAHHSKRDQWPRKGASTKD